MPSGGNPTLLNVVEFLKTKELTKSVYVCDVCMVTYKAEHVWADLNKCVSICIFLLFLCTLTYKCILYIYAYKNCIFVQKYRVIQSHKRLGDCKAKEEEAGPEMAAWPVTGRWDISGCLSFRSFCVGLFSLTFFIPLGW